MTLVSVEPSNVSVIISKETFFIGCGFIALWYNRSLN